MAAGVAAMHPARCNQPASKLAVKDIAMTLAVSDWLQPCTALVLELRIYSRKTQDLKSPVSTRLERHPEQFDRPKGFTKMTDWNMELLLVTLLLDVIQDSVSCNIRKLSS